MIEPHPSPPDLLVLHTLRCHGFASMERLVSVLEGMVPIDVEAVLLTLAARGLVTHHTGEFGGWGLTDAGKSADAQQIALELEQTAGRDDVRAAYDQFLALNRRVLDVCGAWQVRSVDGGLVLNDHGDQEYDARMLEELAIIDAEAQPICSRLGARLCRFAQYGARLSSALDRARRGEMAQVTDSVDSYHTVWFQLHEDLLVTLGITRGT